MQTKCDALKSGYIIKNKEIKISAQNNVGVNSLLTYLVTLIDNNVEKSTYQNIVLCNERQMNLTIKAQEKIAVVLEDINQGCSMDIVASGCKDFIEIIEELLGKITSVDVLNNVFKGFCVGK